MAPDTGGDRGSRGTRCEAGPASRAEWWTVWAWLGYGCLGALLPAAVWVEDWAFLRATSEFYVLGIVILSGGRLGPIVRYVLPASVALTLTVEALTRLRRP